MKSVTSVCHEGASCLLEKNRQKLKRRILDQEEQVTVLEQLGRKKLVEEIAILSYYLRARAAGIFELKYLKYDLQDPDMMLCGRLSECELWEITQHAKTLKISPEDIGVRMSRYLLPT